jgi:DNA-binding transcriptional MerR regulator
VATTITDLAASLGLRSDTLRYYERVGLLVPADRTAAGYRLYDEAASERLRFIRDAQRMGLRLADIKELLDIRDRGQCPCGHTEVLVDRRLSEVQAELGRLQALLRQLRQLKAWNDQCRDASSGQWSCRTSIEGGGEG